MNFLPPTFTKGTRKALIRAQILTVQGLCSHTEGQLQLLQGIGPKRLNEIVGALKAVGLSLKIQKNGEQK